VKGFEKSALLWVVKGMLDMGRNLLHSLEFKSQISNSPY